jgi:hypothetical protein
MFVFFFFYLCDEQFGGSEAIITALSDEYPIIGRHREIFVGCLFSVYFVVGLASCSQVTCHSIWLDSVLLLLPSLYSFESFLLLSRYLYLHPGWFLLFQLARSLRCRLLHPHRRSI